VNQCKYALATTKYVANAVQQSVDNASAKLELSLIGALDKLSHDAVAAEAVNLIKKDYDNRIDELQQKLTSLQRQLADLELQKTDESRHPRERAPSKQRTPKSPVPVHK
jgi:hypothetical protein